MNYSPGRCSAPTLVLLTAAALFAIRLAGPPNLMDKDQERPASYVLDAVRNSHWIVQHDWMGALTSKPPLYTWLSALATLPFERINRFSLYLPSALSVLVTALIILRVGTAYFGSAAGLFAGMVLILSPIMSRQIALARTDALFMCTVSLAAVAAFDAWTRGRGWTAFWVLAAIATLAKGPLGVVLAAGGLLAAFWETRSGRPAPLRGSHGVGILFYVLLTLGWFALAYHEAGPPLVERLFKRELLSQSVGGENMPAPFLNSYKPFAYFLHRFLPWSLPACVGFWRVLARPAADEPQRRFERFLFCWFFFGLLLFSIAAHQRADLLSPILPAAALLGGREVALWLKSVRSSLQLAGTVLVAALVLGFNANYCAKQMVDPWVRKTLGMEQLAGKIREKVGDAPLVHVESPYTLQFYLNTMSTMVSPQEAARLLAGSNRVYVTVCDFGLVRQHLPDGLAVREVARWPESGEPFARVVSNQ